MNDWISVKEKLPEETGKLYLVTVAIIWPNWITYRVDVVEYFHDRTWDVGKYETVTAWMDPPEAYEENKEII